MDSRKTLEKLKGTPEDDEQIQAMVTDCNALINRYNALILSDASSSVETVPLTNQEMQALYIQIVNYKKKLEKIRLGY